MTRNSIFYVQVWQPNHFVRVKTEFNIDDPDSDLQQIDNSNFDAITDSKPQPGRSMSKKCDESDDNKSSVSFNLPPSDLMRYARELRPRTSLAPMLVERKNVKLVDLDILEAEKKFACGRCARKFSTKHGMMQHVRYECRQEPRFECSYCVYKCKRPWVIGEHLRKQHRGKPMKYFDNYSET